MGHDSSSSGVFVMVGIVAFGQVCLMAFVVFWICYKEGPCFKHRASPRTRGSVRGARAPLAFDRTEHMDPADTDESDEIPAPNGDTEAPIPEPPQFLVSTWIVSVAERIRRVNYVTRSRQAEEGLRLPVDEQPNDGLPSYSDVATLPVYSQVVEGSSLANLPPPPKYEDITEEGKGSG